MAPRSSKDPVPTVMRQIQLLNSSGKLCALPLPRFRSRRPEKLPSWCSYQRSRPCDTQQAGAMQRSKGQHGRFHQLGVLFVGVCYFGVYIGAPEFLETVTLHEHPLNYSGSRWVTTLRPDRSKAELSKRAWLERQALG